MQALKKPSKEKALFPKRSDGWKTFLSRKAKTVHYSSQLRDPIGYFPKRREWRQQNNSSKQSHTAQFGDHVSDTHGSPSCSFWDTGHIFVGRARTSESEEPLRRDGIVFPNCQFKGISISGNLQLLEPKPSASTFY